MPEPNISRREFLEILGRGIACVAGYSLLDSLLVPNAYAMDIRDNPSPKRRTRRDREDTRFIVLHTTEADGSSSLSSLTKYGNANYLVDTNGRIYRIMKQSQISKGCGRSMWNGQTNLDDHAVNIEFVGYHNREPTKKQYGAGRELIQELQGIYHVDDADVMPHSQVAYGRPNRWHRRSHRGRKRCGMLFATTDARNKLGLTKKHRRDPDISSGRLVVADTYLAGVIYGSAILAEEPEMLVDDENGEVFKTVRRGESLWVYTGDEYGYRTTIYVLPDGRVRRGDELKKEGFDFEKIQPGTQVATGYVYGGHVSSNRTAYEICGKNWNNPSTMFLLPGGKIITGDDINDDSIPSGTLVLFRD